MAKRLNISFKETVEEQKILDEINKKLDKSAFVKEVLREYFENNKKPKRSNDFDDDCILDILR